MSEDLTAVPPQIEHTFYCRCVSRRNDVSGESARARDRLILAELSGVTMRHMPLSGAYPQGEDAAVAEVRAVARGRADLLAQLAGTYLGLSVTQPVDQLAAQLVAQASLAARAGANMDAVAGWIAVGVKRGDDIRASRRRGGGGENPAEW
jgi:hypothetical protein